MLTRQDIINKLEYLAIIGAISGVKKHVVDMMIFHLAPQIQLADDNLLADIYNTTEAIPDSSTRRWIREHENLVLPNGSSIVASGIKAGTGR